MAEDVYTRLREFLDGLPGGFPATDSGVEIKLLKRYFTPQEAELAMQLKPVPESVAAIAERLGADEAQLAESLESMARQGSIYRIRMNDEPYYMAMQFLIGIYEFHLNAMDRELAELLDEYLPYLTSFWGTLENTQMRVVPVGDSLDTTTSVATYDDAREMVRGQDAIAVADCICRKEKQLLDQPCDHPMESCLTFGLAARYYIENGLGREIAVDECLRILDQAEEHAMVLAPSNSQVMMNICTCCGDSCNMLRGMKTFERPADHAHSTYQASVDSGLCVYCGTCLERCQIDALIEKDGHMEVDLARCIGCGLCVTTCTEGALSMVPKPGAKEPPANFVEMQMKIAAERGLV